MKTAAHELSRLPVAERVPGVWHPTLALLHAAQCDKKIGFPSYRAAKRARTAMRLKRRAGADELLIFRCSACHLWHLGNFSEHADETIRRTKRETRKPEVSDGE